MNDQISKRPPAFLRLSHILRSPLCAFPSSFLPALSAVVFLSACLPAPSVVKGAEGLPELYDAIRPNDSLAGRTIVLDPGHFSSAPGAIGPRGTREMDLNLTVALHLQALLESSGARVYLTRRTAHTETVEVDTPTRRGDLAQRAKYINLLDPDLLVSIHHNSSADPAVNNSRVFYRFPLFGPNASAAVARNVAAEFENLLGLPTSVHFGNYFILRKTHCPAILGEPSYLSHPRNEDVLRTNGALMREALAYYRGIIEYFASQPVKPFLQSRSLSADGTLTLRVDPEPQIASPSANLQRDRNQSNDSFRTLSPSQAGTLFAFLVPGYDTFLPQRVGDETKELLEWRFPSSISRDIVFDTRHIFITGSSRERPIATIGVTLPDSFRLLFPPPSLPAAEEKGVSGREDSPIVMFRVTVGRPKAFRNRKSTNPLSYGAAIPFRRKNVMVRSTQSLSPLDTALRKILSVAFGKEYRLLRLPNGTNDTEALRRSIFIGPAVFLDCYLPSGRQARALSLGHYPGSRGGIAAAKRLEAAFTKSREFQNLRIKIRDRISTITVQTGMPAVELVLSP
ncbi:MAG: hypothetical protein D6679_00250 [Candidatus Hydrogenedentota bacterium]|nr:MAG: hypothetical protein D6679_00250 [Candidatus Hydrogenedentota bacterium]